MSRGNKPPKPKPFESTGKSKDTFSAIYESMLVSDAWKDLPLQTRSVYLCMKAQYFGKRKPREDYPDIEKFSSEECFYFTQSDCEKYGLYNNHNAFRNRIKELEEHGFIETVLNGRLTRHNSIYKFSSEWKYWRKS